jgi:hypothetical protein
MEQKMHLRTDPALRALAVAGMGAIAIVSIAFYRAGWGGPNIIAYVALLMIGVVGFGLVSWPAKVDALGRLRLAGLNQHCIPLAAIQDVREAGRWVEIRWLDESVERIRRVYPRDAESFVAWLRHHVDGAADG